MRAFGVGPGNIALLQIVNPQNSLKIDLKSPFLTPKWKKRLNREGREGREEKAFIRQDLQD